jgi:signal transduction histidine kinase
MDCLQWIIQDITERKDLDRLREDLISMVYHDLRSPLGNIVSSLDLVIAMLPGELDPTIKSLFQIAMRSTERIQRLTNSLLDISRLESNQPVKSPTTFTNWFDTVKPSSMADGKSKLYLHICRSLI